MSGFLSLPDSKKKVSGFDFRSNCFFQLVKFILCGGKFFFPKYFQKKSRSNVLEKWQLFNVHLSLNHFWSNMVQKWLSGHHWQVEVIVKLILKPYGGGKTELSWIISAKGHVSMWGSLKAGVPRHSSKAIWKLCGCLRLTSEWSPPALWPCVPAAGIWSPVQRWCSRCSAWCLRGSGCTSPKQTMRLLHEPLGTVMLNSADSTSQNTNTISDYSVSTSMVTFNTF